MSDPMDMTPVTIPNPAQFDVQVQELHRLYQSLQPAVRSLIGQDAQRRPTPRTADELERIGTGAERLEDIYPNIVNSLFLMSDFPSVGIRDELLDHYRARTGPIIDMARQELADPASQSLLDELKVKTNAVYTQLERGRDRPAGHVERIASEPRRSWAKE